MTYAQIFNTFREIESHRSIIVRINQSIRPSTKCSKCDMICEQMESLPVGQQRTGNSVMTCR
jgi:hypothetical protein